MPDPAITVATFPALSLDDIEKGYVRPLRRQVVHREPCGRPTEMHLAQAEDMARDPHSWSTCYCGICGRRLPLEQFTWADGSPVGS
jgi:hypothetical protein